MTSQRGPYQKIVDGVSPRLVETGDVIEQDRKHHRTDNSNSSSVQKTIHDSIPFSSASATKLETVRYRNHRDFASRRSSNYHSTESTALGTAASNKKRRRLSHFNLPTSTAAPSQTMPHSWYSYFRPLEQDLPEDDILPFLDFGRKLSPSLPTPPSGINSIENKSATTKSKSKDMHSANIDTNSTPVDEDVLPENMDVTVIKKAVERNSPPRVAIQPHAPGISEYYRRRHPSVSQTADNLVITSPNCSPHSSSHNNNNNTRTDQNIRKTNRQHYRHVEAGNEEESKCNVSSTEKPTEMQNSSTNLTVRSKQESFIAPSPVAAESSLVTSVKHVETPETLNFSSTNMISTNITRGLKPNGTSRRTNRHDDIGNSSSAVHRLNKTQSNDTAQEDNTKAASTTSPNTQLTTRILSTAVVTSVSLKESSLNNSDNRVTAPPPLQSPFPTRLARVVNSTIDRTNRTFDNSTVHHTNETPKVVISGNQSTTDTGKALPAERRGRLNHTVVAVNNEMLTGNITSKEKISPEVSLESNRQPNNSSTTEKNSKEITNNSSTKRENHIQTLEANHSITSDKRVKQNTRNLSSSESEIRVDPLKTNHTISVDNNATYVTSNFISESVVPIESTQPTVRRNHTSQIEKDDKNLTSDLPTPIKSSQATSLFNYTSIIEKSNTNLKDNLSSIVKADLNPEGPLLTSLPTNRSSNAGNDSSTDTDDPLAELETTTVSLWHVPADSSFTTNDTKESPVNQENLPKTANHENTGVAAISSLGDTTNQSSEVAANASTTDGNVHDDNNTITDLDATDMYYDYGLTLPEANSNNATVVKKIPEEDSVEEDDDDSWLQNGRNLTDSEPDRTGNYEIPYAQPAIESSTYILVGLSIIPILLGAVVAARFFLLRNKKKVLDESEYSSEYNRSPLSISNASPLPTKLPRVPQHLGWEMEKSPPSLAPSPPSSKWEFPREKLRLQTVLGQGNFGQVWKAEADDISGHEGLTRLVAVKTVKESASAREREDSLRELGIMQDLGSHPNVVTLLGCCTEKEPYYLIMEYVMYGKLLTFLRDHRTRAHYYNFSDITDALTSRDLTVFMYCVARGMDYLTNKGIIHRDLAARNVLVDHNKLCKIADFGMSRNVRDTGQIYEQRQSKGALPIRWMAPESLHYSLFTHRSDVWSFGILLWEIITLGSTPYATMGAREVMRRVRDGYRLERPSHCRPELFRIISRCWHADSSKRPTFSELKHELGQLLSDIERGGNYIDLDSLHEELKQSSQGSTLQRNQ